MRIGIIGTGFVGRVSQAWWALGSLWLALVVWSFLNGTRF